MSATVGVHQQEVQAHYQRALELLGSARDAERRELELVGDVRQLVDKIERISGSLPGDSLSRSLHHWGRELINGNLTSASIHLTRVGVELGLRGSYARPWSVAPPSKAAAAPVRSELREKAPRTSLRSPPQPAPQPVARREAPPPVAPVAAAEGPLSVLSPEERALVECLPLAAEPLHGANELAQCWGDVMNPTSARGRYSRLANKLRDVHGRDLLLRGRGRYARLESWG